VMRSLPRSVPGANGVREIRALPAAIRARSAIPQRRVCGDGAGSDR
jgi:hypothetical protein